MSSSLASSPPKSGAPINWVRMQSFPEQGMRQPMLDPSMQGGQLHPGDRLGNTGFGPRRIMSEELGMPMGKMGPPPGMPGMFEDRPGVGTHGHFGHMGRGGYGQHGAGFMGAERSFGDRTRGLDDRFAEYADHGMSSSVREMASRMNDVNLSHGRMSHPDFKQRPGERPMDPRERMMMPSDLSFDGPGAGMKMHPGYMYGGMGAHPGVPYIPAQPPGLPFGGMHGGYGPPMAARYDMAGNTQPAAKHNKYCHFCQHVKVRASGMLACSNKDCTRRFCEHCLSKSIGDDVNPQTSNAWINGLWHCPVCRKLCCCAIGECDKNHRHCKAYRYRVRRAEQQASKRATGGGVGGEDEGDGYDSPEEEKEKEDAEEEKPQDPRSQDPRPQDPRPQDLKPRTSTIPIVKTVKAETPSPTTIRRRATPTGMDNNGLDFNDVQTVADSWLKLFQDEDVEDDSFLFQADGQMPPGFRMDGRTEQGMSRDNSRDALYREDSGEAFARMLHGANGEDGREVSKAIRYNPMGDAGLNTSQGHSSMNKSGSSESLQMLNAGIMLQNGQGTQMNNSASNESLVGMMPRNFSNSSLTAVMEQSESFVGEDAHIGQGTGADFDFLRSAGAQAVPVPGGGGTGKRMQRTNSHNNLVRDAVRGHQGMPRPPSYEKLSRFCPPEYIRQHGMPPGMPQVGMPSTKEDEPDQ
eukprot:CAMPEP_0184303188 /NCGR_PEP_ID=MMETSP1049-20130417/12972_1 /TAXON_ID=77928 /ORGANISM="Proteomonas sulcata, Strain CCMP704" /LENGTH=690 /DNA_ID=CAMNT_0026614649 /DNA_START=96 /DNA_END=2168 /DNA_ORIENTATION=+